MTRLLLAAFLASAVASPPDGATGAALPSAPEAADAAAAFGYVMKGGPPSTGMAVETAPVLTNDPVKTGGAVLTVQVRHAGVGRLVDPISANFLALDAGTLLFATNFRSSADQAEALESWCGQGHGGVFKIGATVCIVGTPDGKARLLNGLVSRLGEDTPGPIPQSFIHSAPSWYVQAIQPDRMAQPVARPRIAPADVSELPPLQLRLENRGVYRNELVVASFLSPTTGEKGNQVLRAYKLPLIEGVARMPFGRFALVLTPSPDGVRARWEERGVSAATAAPVVVSASVGARLAPTRFVIGGARIDPTSLTATEGPVGLDGKLVQGTATHWRTARADIDISVIGLHVRTAKDAVFHEVEVFGQDQLGARTIRRAWCGAMSSLGLETIRCLPIKADGTTGDAAFFANGRRWMAVVPRSGSQSVGTDRAEITPSETDLIGPMNFSLRLNGVGRRLSVQAEVERAGETVVIWKGAVPFDGQGVARLPFWSRTLIASKPAKQEDAVLVRMEDGADGTGPLEAEVATPR